MLSALNVVYGRTETRGMVRYMGVSFVLTAGLAIFVVLAVATILLAPPILAALGIEREITSLVTLLRWPILFIVGAAGIQILYRFGPSHDSGARGWIGAGSLAASALWVAFSAALSWYLSIFGSFTELYGSMRAVVGFMLWLWLSALATLAGAEVDAARMQTARQA
jgi:membrane protein